jgi:hypothetical protein
MTEERVIDEAMEGRMKGRERYRKRVRVMANGAWSDSGRHTRALIGNGAESGLIAREMGGCETTRSSLKDKYDMPI